MDDYLITYEEQIFKEPTALQFWIDLFWMMGASLEIMYIWFFLMPDVIVKFI